MNCQSIDLLRLSLFMLGTSKEGTKTSHFQELQLLNRDCVAEAYAIPTLPAEMQRSWQLSHT